jgi:two-component system sensor histidine kinase DesK
MHFLRTHFRRVFVPSATTEDGPQTLMALSGITPWLWRLYAGFWLICWWYALFLLLQTHVTPVRLGFILGGGLVCAVLYLWFVWPHPIQGLIRWRTHFRLALCGFVVLTVLVMILSLFDNPAWLWLLVCVSAVAGLIFPLRLAAVVVVQLTLWCLVLGVLRLGWVQAIPLALLVRGLGLDMIGLILLMGALQQMQRQRQALAHLAVAEERLRVTRDLHDLLGRNLSAVTLKSALAARLVITDPSQAIAEMHALEQLARATLREVRVAIAGYRQLTIAHEIEGAQQLLAAAGIAPSITVDSHTLSPTIEEALAGVIREGVTNVLRHSRATYCQIVLEHMHQSVWLEVSNDGCPGGIITPGQGYGIAGLRERLAALGGRLSTEQRTPTTFCLRAEVPCHVGVSEETA